MTMENPGAMTGSFDDARMAQAMAAQSAERRNRPRFLVVAAVGLLFVAIVFTIFQSAQRMSVKRRLASKADEIRLVNGWIEKIQALRATSSDAIHDADPSMGSKLEQAAALKGFSQPIVVGTTSETPVGVREKIKNAERRKFTAKIVGEDAQVLLDWLAATVNEEQFDGLEISSISMDPKGTLPSGYPSWDLDVTFFRWEKKQ